MLMSEFQHNIDKKGRIFIPAKLREDLGDGFVLSKALDSSKCLFIYPAQEWRKLVQKISELPFSKARTLQRYLYAGAIEASCDTQGRILLPPVLRAFAELNEETTATIVGAANRIEIWNTDNWLRETQNISQDEILSILEECEL